MIAWIIILLLLATNASGQVGYGTTVVPSGGGHAAIIPVQSGGGASCSGDINTACSQVTGTHLTNPLPQAQGGWGALDEEGSHINGDTVTCGTATVIPWVSCHFTITGGGNPSITLANPVNLPVNALVFVTYSTSAVAIFSFGANWFQWNVNTRIFANPPSNQLCPSQNGTCVTTWWSDGTNLYLVTPADAQMRNLVVEILQVSGNVTFQGITAQLGLVSNNGSVIQSTGGTAPILTAGCNGAGSSVAAGSTNNRGKFTSQNAAATSCTLSFNNTSGPPGPTWGQAPFCVANDGSGGVTPKAISTSGETTSSVTFTFASAVNQIVKYMCL